MLSDIDIKKALEEKWIEVSPLDKGFIQPSSIDLKVGYEFRVFENHKYSHIPHNNPGKYHLYHGTIYWQRCKNQL